MELTLWAVVAVALFFDFTNGFHDTANSIATSVSTRALSPRAAVASAAVLNFAGAFVSIEVAATIAKGIVDQEVITLDVRHGRSRRRDHVEPDHLVPRAALELEPRADRRDDRLRDGRRRARTSSSGVGIWENVLDAVAHRAVRRRRDRLRADPR